MKGMKRVLSLVLCGAMLLSHFPAVSFAAEETGLCEHHMTHVDCGYVESAGEQSCKFECKDCADGAKATSADTEGNIGSGTPDGKPPVLNSITLSAATVTAPGSVEVIVDASDDVSGAYDAEMYLRCAETGKELRVYARGTYYDEETKKDVAYADKKLHGMLKIDQYVESGSFLVEYISLRDVAGNHATYSSSPKEGIRDLPKQVKELWLKVFNTIPDVTTSVSKSDFVDVVEKATDNAYIAANYSGDATMPKEAFEAIASTDKTIDLISEGITWRFEGSDIKEEIKDIDLKVEIQKVEEDSSASGDAIEGNLNGNPGVVMKFPENGTLPGKATIQVKVDYAMREYLGSDTGLSVYYYNNQTGELELIASNLKVINDTYVEFPITHCSYYVLASTLNNGSTNDNTGTCGDNLTWEFDEKTGVLTVKGTGPMYEYADGYVDGKTTPPWADGDRDRIKRVVIEEGVTTISDAAFCGFEKIQSVSIPSTVESIGGIAFEYCYSLERVVLPDNITSIGVSAFLDCRQLSSVVIGSEIETIGGFAFGGCSSLKSITFNGDAPSFGSNPNDVFCDVTATAYYPANNPTWTSNVMQNYGGTITWVSVVTSGTCGNNLTWTYNAGTLTISGTGAMYDYSKDQTKTAPWNHLAGDITKLVLEEGVAEIGDYAFASCSAIKNASFPSTLTRVGEYAFYRFSQPDGNIYHRPFWSEINQTVRQWSQIRFETGNEGFPGWDTTTYVDIDPIIASDKAGDHVYWELNKNGTMEFFGTGDMYEFGAVGSPYAELPVKTVTIGEGITNIGANIFEGWGTMPLTQSFESITIASTVKRVEGMAFTDCKALKSITFTGDAPSFGENCFRGVTATAYYPAGNDSWTGAVMQNYEGTITWKPYCTSDHSFGSWSTEGTVSSRTCTLCGYTEHKVVTDSGDVEMEIPNQPDVEVEVDPVLPSEENYILVEEALENTEYNVLKVFNINLKDGKGDYVQPDGTVKVKLPLDWSKDGNYKVYRVNDNGTLTDMNAYRQGSHMVFETDHFSLYVIAEEYTVTAPTAKTLTYTGEAQALVNAGSSTGGMLQYSLDGVTYSANIPTATNAGAYTVYYKVEGHEDSKGTVPVTIAKAKVIITADDKAAAVGAAMPSLSCTVTGLKGSDKLTSNPTPTCDATMSVVGEYEILVSGGDAGANYEIQRVNGKLSVKNEHKVTVAAATNGTVSASHEKAIEGTEIAITTTPKSGYEMATIKVKGTAGTSCTVSTDNNGKYYFTMPDEDVTVTVTFSKKTTPDKTNPKTGDEFRVDLWSTVAMTSLLCMAAMVFGKKKYE